VAETKAMNRALCWRRLVRFIIILIYFGTPAEALCETADPRADLPDAVASPGASPDFAGHWGGYVSGSEVPAVSYVRRVPNLRSTPRAAWRDASLTLARFDHRAARGVRSH